MDYEISLTASREDGTDFFVGLTFPFRDSHLTLILGGWGGALCGLSCIDGLDASMNETKSFQSFSAGKVYAIKLQVAGQRVSAWLDGLKLFSMDLKGRECSLRTEIMACAPLGVASFQTRTQLHSFQFRALEPNPLSAFEELMVGRNFPDPSEWMTCTVTNSLISNLDREIFFDRQAAYEALLSHRKDTSQPDERPMNWPPGTLFVSRFLNDAGVFQDTEVLQVQQSGSPEFFLFDEQGNSQDTFLQPDDPPGGPIPGNVPSVCVACHTGDGFFSPMMEFPTELSAHRVRVEDGARNLELTKLFLEGFHRGKDVFGPYATMYLAKLQSDAQAGLLDEVGKNHYEGLQESYPELRLP